MYSVKMGYTLLRNLQVSPCIGTKELWEAVWRKGKVLPRIRLFVWKLLHKAVPLAKTMHRRFPHQSPVCVTCGREEEDASHLLYLCLFSRTCFLTGPLGMRTEGFGGVFVQVL